MKKTIIVTSGIANQGKSESIKNVCKIILNTFNNAEPSIKKELIDYTKDILLTIKIGDIKIGFESQGDPNSRMIWEDTIRKLADDEFDPILGGCQIIICASRSSGATVEKIEEISVKHSYDTIWKSNLTSKNLLTRSNLNRISAQNTIDLIKSIISGEI
ncbi:hypothetical protein [Emticicia soli]|uniref:Uncharacterized protein n=1 Tax=Emticicia soli TaxID=2027878 RepID=A0ABW5J192_9BACT